MNTQSEEVASVWAAVHGNPCGSERLLRLAPRWVWVNIVSMVVGGRRTLHNCAAAAFSAAMLIATLAPVVQNWSEAPSDGFPFSYYPMFAQPVGPTYPVTHALARSSQGDERVVPYRYFKRGGFNEVRQYVAREAHLDPPRLCQRVLMNLRTNGTPELRQTDELVLLTGAYRLESFYAGRLEREATHEHARCRAAP